MEAITVLKRRIKDLQVVHRWLEEREQWNTASEVEEEIKSLKQSIRTLEENNK